MSRRFDPARLEQFRAAPGVYLMHGDKGQVLYVGKAKNIKNRLKSYFAGGDDRAQVPFLLAQLVDIETIIVSSEKEALLLENTLIKRYQPKYNVLLKDDKGYISLRVTTKHPWPRLELVRYKGPTPKDGTYFGPYTSAFAARQMFDLVGKVFPLRQCSDEEFARRKRPCILYQIKRCSAPCVGYVTKEAYQESLDGAVELIQGKNDSVLVALDNEMKEASDALEFEKAGLILRKKRLLESVISKQTITTLGDIDGWAIYRQGADIIITKLMWRSGRLMGSHHFDFENNLQPTNELLASFLVQHYLIENQIPPEILLYHELDDHDALAELFSEKKGAKVEVKTPTKGEKKKLATLAYANAEATFTQRRDADVLREKALLEIQDTLHLTRYPKRIDCFDNSHLAGSELVSACVSFVDGKKETSGYRKFKIRTVTTGDDYAMIKEALFRRYGKEKEESQLPDLIIIDGGKGHLAMAQKVLKDLEIVSCDLIAIAKEAGRHDKGVTAERIFVQDRASPVAFKKESRALFLLQNIRDEAHRFVLAYQTTRRKKATIKSQLDDIVGVGPAKKKALIKAFGSVKAIAEKSVQELVQVASISQKNAQDIVDFFQNKG
jgi:excinuclease ABC subunit C